MCLVPQPDFRRVLEDVRAMQLAARATAFRRWSVHKLNESLIFFFCRRRSEQGVFMFFCIPQKGLKRLEVRPFPGLSDLPSNKPKPHNGSNGRNALADGRCEVGCLCHFLAVA